LPVPRVPALGLLWLGLALAYLACAMLGQAALALAVLGLMAGAGIGARGHRAAGLAAALVLAVAAWRFADAVAFLAYVPPLAAFAFMTTLFGRTLRDGSEPLISRIARKEHPDLAPDVARHTRRLTVLWTACFASLFLAALGLAAFLPLEAWSRAVQALGVALPGALFLGEYAWRLRRFPGRSRGSLATLAGNVIAVFREGDTGAGAASCREPQ
jgi:uncharacterized membrane protein